MSLDHILLGMLREPASGYDLRKEFERTAVHFWSARLSQIYPTLKRMEEEGWLSVREEPSAKGPPRKVYRLTPEGRAELTEWLESGPEISPQRLPYVAQLCFMDELGDPDAIRAFVTELRSEFGRRLRALREIERQSTGAPPASCPEDGGEGERHGEERRPDGGGRLGEGERLGEEGRLGPVLTLRLGIAVHEARIRWCDETLELLEGGDQGSAPGEDQGSAPGETHGRTRGSADDPALGAARNPADDPAPVRER